MRKLACCRAERLEIFDELEEWHLIQASYIKIAFNADVREMHSSIFLSPIWYEMTRQPIISFRVWASNCEKSSAGALLHCCWDQ